MYSQSDLVSMVSAETIINNAQLAQEYSLDLHNSVMNHWDEVRTDFNFDPTLLSNFLRYRLGYLAPFNQQDYQPTHALREHTVLIVFLISAIAQFLHNVSFVANFSPALIMQSRYGSQFLWSSPHNFLCLPVSMTVSDRHSLRQFLKRVEDFDLANYLSQATRTLSDRYDDVQLLCVSLQFTFTRLPNIAYGGKTVGMASCCHDYHPYHHNIFSTTNNCFFNSLSTHFMVKNGYVVKKTPISHKINRRTGYLIKKTFWKWLFSNNQPDVNLIFNQYGITTYGLALAEKFLCHNINIWQKTSILIKKLIQRKLISSSKVMKRYVMAHKSCSRYEKEINFIQGDTLNWRQKHLICVTNIRYVWSKYICESCNSRFAYPWLLKRHQKSVCGREKKKYLSNTKIPRVNNFFYTLSKLIPEHELVLDKYFHLITLTKTNSTISAQITNPNTETNSIFQSKTEYELAEKVLNHLHMINPVWKEMRLRNNIGFLAKFYAKLQHKNQPDTFHETTFLRESLCQYLSTSQIFIMIPFEEQQLLKNFTDALMRHHFANYSPDSCNYQSRRGKLSQLSLIGKKTGLQVFSVHNIIPQMYSSGDGKSDFFAFKNVANLIMEHFKVDIFSGFINSATQIARIIFDSCIVSGQNFAFMSPSKALIQELENSTKYGHLQAHKSIINDMSPLKTLYVTDFIKFHTSILSQFKPYFGTALTLVKKGTEFVQETRFNFCAFANIFFTCLAKLTYARVFFQLLGPEEKLRYPVDLVILFPRPYTGTQELWVKSYGFYHGCFHHGCKNPCHIKNSRTKTHISTCETCQASSKPSRSKHRPQLWTMPSGQTHEKSFHPHLKKTYQEVHERTIMIENLVAAESEIGSVLVLRECELIAYFDKPVKHLLEYLNLPPRPDLDTSEIFSCVFDRVVTQCFPLLGLKGKKITMDAIIRQIRAGTIHGLLKASGKCMEKTEKLLGNFKIFSILNEHGQMCNSNQLQNQLITSEFLQYLIDSKAEYSPDFVLTGIQKIFLFPNIEEKPFQNTCQYLLELMKRYKDNKYFSGLLKGIPNLYCGQMAVSADKFPDTYFLRESDFQSLRQLKNFMTSYHLDNGVYAAKFSSVRPIRNHCHNFFQITQKGRQIFVQCLIALTTYLDCQLGTCNCDSMWLNSPIRAKPTYPDQEPILILDQLLRPGLTASQYAEYVRVKFKYFLQTGVCHEHSKAYLNSLVSGTTFYPSPCCKEYESIDDNPFKLKSVGYGNKGLILSINKSIYMDETTNEAVVKCSGIKNKQFDLFFKSCDKDTQSFLMDFTGDHE